MTTPSLQDAVERYCAERTAGPDGTEGPQTEMFARAVAVASLPLVRSMARRVTLPDHPLAAYRDLENAGMLVFDTRLGYLSDDTEEAGRQMVEANKTIFRVFYVCSF